MLITRRNASLILVFAPASLLATPKSADQILTDPSDRETWKWLLGRFGEKESIRMKGDTVELLGMTNKGPYDVGVMIDDKGRVVRARFNHANFTNDEWRKLTGFRHLLDLTCWHNFQDFAKDQPRPDLDGNHPLSGEGLIAFKDHPLQALNIGGSTFNNLGFEALTRLPRFRKIMAYHTRVNDEGLKVLAGNQNIHFLNLGPQFSMKITEKSLEFIGQMKALTELEFNETRLTWQGLKFLLPLKEQLKRVKLEKTWIEQGLLEKAREAFPKTVFEHSEPEPKSVEQMERLAKPA